MTTDTMCALLFVSSHFQRFENAFLEQFLLIAVSTLPAGPHNMDNLHTIQIPWPSANRFTF